MENEFEKGFMCGYLINYHVDEPKPDQKEWTYPSNWLKLPEPADNQIVMLVDNRGSSVYNNTSYEFVCGLDVDSYHSTKIEWGDGTYSESINDSGYHRHIYEQGTGHKAGNSEQWIVTITFDSDENNNAVLNRLAQYDSCAYVLAIKIGNTKYVNKNSIYCFNSRLQYAKICRGEFTFRFDGSHVLKKVELHENITKIPKSAFFYSYSLIDINLENITEIGAYAFENCESMNFSGKMPKLKTIGEYGLSYTNTSSLDFPSLESIGEYSFYSCHNLTECRSETLKTIGQRAFENCKTLRIVDLPYATELEKYVFHLCYELESVNLPLVTKIGDYCFAYDFVLRAIDLRSCTDIGSESFNSCYGLDHCILPTNTDTTGKFNYSYNVTFEFEGQ